MANFFFGHLLEMCQYLNDEDKEKYMVTRMHASNHRKNRSSDMVMDQVAVTSTNKSYFTVAYLEKE